MYLLYIVSIIVFYYYLALQITDTDQFTDRSVLIAWIVCTYMNFLVQLAMIVIFMQMKSN